MRIRTFLIILALVGLMSSSFVSHRVTATNNAVITAPTIVNTALVTSSIVTFAINVSNVGPSPETLHAWQLFLHLNATLLKITQVIEGPALKDIANALGGNTLFTGKFNATQGLVQSSDLIVVTSYPDAGFTGNGTLVYVKAQVLALGTTSLLMDHEDLISITSNQASSIGHTVVNGLFSNVAYNVPPKASFTISPSTPIATQPTTFDASSSYDLDGTIVKYSWKFGDGNQTDVTVPVIKHSYANAGGPINVTLTVIDDGSPTGVAKNASSVQKIYVKGVILPPRAIFTFSPPNPRPGDSVTFNATASYDPNPNHLSLKNPNWNFGDGTLGGGYVVTHIFNSAGNYSVTLTITNGAYLWDNNTQTVHVSGELVHAKVDVFPYWTIPTGIVGAVIAAAVGLFFRRSRRIKAEEAEDSSHR